MLHSSLSLSLSRSLSHWISLHLISPHLPLRSQLSLVASLGYGDLLCCSSLFISMRRYSVAKAWNQPPTLKSFLLSFSFHFAFYCQFLHQVLFPNSLFKCSFYNTSDGYDGNKDIDVAHKDFHNVTQPEYFYLATGRMSTFSLTNTASCGSHIYLSWFKT